MERDGVNEQTLMPVRYEALYQRIIAAASRSAADALFVATGEELRQTYRLGETETTG